MGFQQFAVVLKDEIERSMADHEPMALALFGIDMLKELGDRFGQEFCENHGTGSGQGKSGSASAARTARAAFRAMSSVSSSPRPTRSLLDKTVDHVRKTHHGITIKTPGGENINPVLSAGVALCGETTASPEVLHQMTGQALGRARQRGDSVEVSALRNSE